MYKVPPQYVVPEEVKKFNEDCESLGMLCDEDNQYITPNWAERFKAHLERILVLAEKGDPWAQYSAGNMSLLGYLHDSKQGYESNYERDAAVGSAWLEKAASQGFVAAVDNLVCVGVGDEANRLREISKLVKKEHPYLIEKQKQNDSIPVITPAFFEKVWEIAYGKNR